MVTILHANNLLNQMPYSYFSYFLNLLFIRQGDKQCHMLQTAVNNCSGRRFDDLYEIMHAL